jgi:hypothetical protein
MKWESAAALFAAAFVTAACADTKPAAPPATTAPAAVAPATTAPAATTVAASEFGVPECDEYMNKWMACVDSKVPAEHRGMYKTAIEQSKSSWKQAASTPQGKQGLATACTQQLAATKQALAAYNCTW